MKSAVRFLAATGLAALTAGCVTTGDPNDPLIWSRFDCQEYQPGELAQAQAICSGRAEAASVAGTIGMPSSGPKLSNAIVDGISSGIAGARISIATGTACMAEYGFTKRPRSASQVACAVPPGPRPVAPRVIGTPVPAPRATTPPIGQPLAAPTASRARPAATRYDEILDAY